MLPEASDWKKRWKTPRAPGAGAPVGSLMTDILAGLSGRAILPWVFFGLSELFDLLLAPTTWTLRELAGRLVYRAAGYARS